MSQNRLFSTKSHSIDSITPTQVLLATKENKLIDTSVKNVGLIKALEQRLHLIPLNQIPQGSSLFQFFDHQRKEMDFISDRILEMKYGRIESAENPIPPPTSFPLSPQTHFILRQDNPFSIFNDRSHMPLSFAPVPDENRFNIAKFVWDLKNAVAAQNKTEVVLQQSKRKMDLHTRTNNKVVPISSHIAPSGDLVYLDLGPSIQHVDLEVSKYDMSPEDYNLIKHGLLDDDKDDNLDSNILIEETLSGIEEFYDAVEQQSNSDVVEQQRKKRELAQLLADTVEHTSICTIKKDIVADEGPPKVTLIYDGPDSQLKDVLFQTSDLKEKEVNVISGIETPHVQLAIYPAKWDRPI
ncbi:hypothetical protein MTR67_026280 [Solanum verrucosum]|uniref:Uncharacterized protein n=1 Tax=Solanum verrucosum TaxID=315347 RepID=A0AAF0R571_SOLVR|nr:hypothetical protein MTR67_026280 [Solanum verrucosum]